MSTTFRTETIRKLHSHEIWGIFCTDAAGMGLDLRDIELVVQWKHTKSLCMLWQRLGRVARDTSKEATGIYIVEPQYMDHRRVQAEEKAASQAEKERRRLQDAPDTANVTSPRRVRAAVEKGGPKTQKRPRHQYDQSSAIRATGKLIVQEQRHQDHEAAAIDAYINARSRGICRRGISNEFFSNRPASPSMACSEGCSRCVVKASRLCCDTCNPGSFILPLPTISAPKQTRAPNKFKAGLYRSTDADLSLKSALEDWRDAQLGHIGIPGDDMYGSQLIMTDDVLERFVDLAHFNQLVDLSSIRAQVNWRYNDTWGMQILELVKKHVPRTDSVDQPAAAPGPRRLTLQPTDTGNIPGPSTSRQPPGVQSSAITLTPDASNPKPRTRKAYKCSACGSSAHIGTPVRLM
ncbi:hypothetical protein EDB83DRAFT_2527937 [Lactarius deliciosus]|nr:hypothetical protein EDB83DRAFT_2527937 [Lactarius deliciosus]